MGMIVAFEGPDASGKSTAIEALTKEFPYNRWPRVAMRIPDAVLHDQNRLEIERMSLAFYRGLVPMKKSMSFLMDRCYVSDLVYNRAFRRRTNEEEMEQLMIIALELRPIIVYVQTPKQVVLERIWKRGDRHLQNQAEAEAVIDSYDLWLNVNPLKDRIVTIDGTTDWSAAENVSALVRAIEGAE